MGHKASCPKCKGIYTIIEGVVATTFYGKGVAIAGMKTSCGAILIATQFTDTVDIEGGTSASPLSSASPAETVPPAANLAPTSRYPCPVSLIDDAVAPDDILDEQFVLRDQEGNCLRAIPYTIELASGEKINGVTDEEGKTKRYKTETVEDIKIYLGHVA